MEKNIYHCTIWLFPALFLSISLLAQEEIVFNPSELIPHNDGYYIKGVWVDEDKDGNLEFHNKCEDYYEDDVSDGFYDPHWNHEETGEQQGFKYFNCMIMPDCEHKSEPIDPPVATGYIQMSACMYSLTDSAIYSYIQTPSIINLVSIYMETSSDVSINEKRQIPYNIEYSKDNGTTWENVYLLDNVAAQGGYRVTYDGSVNSEIQHMIDASKVNPVVLRIITNDRAVEGANQGQFVKLHSLKLTAEKASSVQAVTTIAASGFVINELNIISNDKPLKVYNLMGQIIGIGQIVSVPSTGIYLVRTADNNIQKVLIK